MKVQEMVNELNTNCNDFTLCLQLEEVIDRGEIEKAINLIQTRFNCDQETATQCFTEFKKQIYDEFKKIENKNPLSPEQMAYNNMIAKELLNKPKCPICGSKNLSKIKTIEKVMKIAAFGIYGMGDNGKTYKCNNCGSKF